MIQGQQLVCLEACGPPPDRASGAGLEPPPASNPTSSLPLLQEGDSDTQAAGATGLIHQWPPEWAVGKKSHLENGK